ncbi:type II toxin-antitoxin system VapB family antitoxin [Nocardia sp. NPDC001965]
MARTVIDVDDEKLAAAAEIFGTTTKVATVDAALEGAIERRRRQSFLDRIGSDYDMIAAVTGQPTRWLVPAGTADCPRGCLRNPTSRAARVRDGSPARATAGPGRPRAGAR